MVYHLGVGISPRYITKPTRSTQPCIPLGLLYRVPAFIAWGKGKNITSAGGTCNTVIPYGMRVLVVVRLVANCYMHSLTLPILPMGPPKLQILHNFIIPQWSVYLAQLGLVCGQCYAVIY